MKKSALIVSMTMMLSMASCSSNSSVTISGKTSGFPEGIEQSTVETSGKTTLKLAIADTPDSWIGWQRVWGEIDKFNRTSEDYYIDVTRYSSDEEDTFEPPAEISDPEIVEVETIEERPSQNRPHPVFAVLGVLAAAVFGVAVIIMTNKNKPAVSERESSADSSSVSSADERPDGDSAEMTIIVEKDENGQTVTRLLQENRDESYKEAEVSRTVKNVESSGAEAVTNRETGDEGTARRTSSASTTAKATVTETTTAPRTTTTSRKTTTSKKATETEKTTTTKTPVKKLSSVSLDISSLSLDVTQFEWLLATVSPADGVSTKVTWSSSNDSVASVTDNGCVYAEGAGTAVITARTSDGAKDTCKVTVTDPWKGYTRINDADDFYNINFDLDGKYVLMQPIELPSDWIPIGTYSSPFTGELRGNNNSISLYGLSNVTYGDGQYSGGIFGTVRDAEISDITLYGSYSYDNYYDSELFFSAGMLCGIADGISVISNITNNADVEVHARCASEGSVRVGGIVGCCNCYASISDCKNHGNVFGTMEGANISRMAAGGIYGADFLVKRGGYVQNSKTIERLENTGNISAYCTNDSGLILGSCGGIGGESYISGMVDCFSEGSVSLTCIAGDPSGTYSYCAAGGLIGNNDFDAGVIDIENCYSNVEFKTIYDVPSSMQFQGELIGREKYYVDN